MSEAPLTTFDLAVLAVIVISALFSLIRGAIREALTILAWLGAIAAAYYGFGAAQAIALQTIETNWLADVAALFVVFIVPLIIFKVAALVIAEKLPGGWFGHVDRWVGALFGVLRGALIVCAAYLGLGLVIAPDRQPAWVRDATFLPYVQDGAAVLQRLLPEPVNAPQAGAAARLEMHGPPAGVLEQDGADRSGA